LDGQLFFFPFRIEAEQSKAWIQASLQLTRSLGIATPLIPLNQPSSQYSAVPLPLLGDYQARRRSVQLPALWQPPKFISLFSLVPTTLRTENEVRPNFHYSPWHNHRLLPTATSLTTSLPCRSTFYLLIPGNRLLQRHVTAGPGVVIDPLLSPDRRFVVLARSVSSFFFRLRVPGCFVRL
jgi:hypothetical protein